MKLKPAHLLQIVVTVCILCSYATYAFADSPHSKPKWYEYKSDHFIVYYQQDIPPKYVRDFTGKCERYYSLIAEQLGYRRFDFWSWENRAQVAIYNSQQAYTQAGNRPLWSAASVHIENKFISTYCFAEDYFDVVLPHEIAHLVLREFIGLKTKVPLWFEEGVACANEQGHSKYILMAKQFLNKGAFLPVSQMEKIGSAPVKAKSYTMFYSQAAAIITFLQKNYDQSCFPKLCRQLRDGNSFYGALAKVYGIKDAEDLNNKFLTYLKNNSFHSN